MTVLEAMTQKTPVIGGDGSGAVPWVLDFGKAGILTNVRSPEMIATEAIRLLRDKDLWRYYSLAGYKRARSTFGLAAVVKQYTQIYEGVLAAHSTANQRKRS